MKQLKKDAMGWVLIIAILLIACGAKQTAPYFYSWAGLANNQAVTFGDANDAVSTSVFFSKSSFSSSTTCMTKDDANTYLHVDSSYSPLSSKASNQLVIKSDLKPMMVMAADDLVDGTGTTAGTGSLASIAAYYCGSLAVAPAFYYWGSTETALVNGVTKFYHNYSGRICYNAFGAGKYMIYWPGKYPGFVAIELNSSGVVIDQYSCAA